MTLRSSRMIVRNSSSVSRWNELPQVLVEVRTNRAGRCAVRAAGATGRRSCRPARRRLRIGQHPAHLPLAAPPDPSACRVPPASSSSSSGMLLQRKNDSRDASSSRLSGNGDPGATLAGSRSNRKRKLRIDEHARDRALDAALERAALAAGPEERHQRVHVRPGGRHGTTIRATGERVQDRPRARCLLGDRLPASRTTADVGSLNRQVQWD